MGTLSFKIPDDLHDKLLDMADREGRSLTSLLRYILWDAVEKYEEVMGEELGEALEEEEEEEE